MTRLLLQVASASILLLSRDVAAQTRTQPTTASGVYSVEQAERGRNVYAGYCRSCHTAESHTGATFVATWKDKSLADLLEFLQERMPKNEPGSLSDREYVDVMTYLLKMNGMPAGQSELLADSVSLNRVRIQFPKTTAVREKH